MPKVRVLSRQELDGDRAVALAEFVPVLLAEGDSWFAAGAVPAHNVLQALDFNSHGAVVNLAALPGDHWHWRPRCGHAPRIGAFIAGPAACCVLSLNRPPMFTTRSCCLRAAPI